MAMQSVDSHTTLKILKALKVMFLILATYAF